MLVVGNVYQDVAITLAKMTEEIIPASPLPGLGPADLSLRLPEGMSPYNLVFAQLTARGLVQVPIMFGPIRYPIPMSPTLF
jgi:hypothetical protein